MHGDRNYNPVRDVNEFKQSIDNFELLFSPFGNNSMTSCPIWRNLMNKATNNYDNNELYNFREQLVKFIKNKLCERCTDYGGKKMNSNVDVTIQDENFSVNIETLIKIHRFIKTLFDGVCIFQGDDNKVQLNRVFRFFDLNFYLTNFSFTTGAPAAFALSTQYGRESKSQYYYAFHEILQDKPINVPFQLYISTYLENYKHQLEEYCQPTISSYVVDNDLQDVPRHYACIINHIEKMTNYLKNYKALQNNANNNNAALQNNANNNNAALQNNANNNNANNNNNAALQNSKTLRDKVNHTCNLISLLSTMEDECYHTQGSYFHVVLAMQAAKTNIPLTIEMLCASGIENICFAYSHIDKKDKYINRVIDARERIEKCTVGINEASLEYKIYDILSKVTRDINLTKKDLAITISSLLQCFYNPPQVGGHTIKKMFDKYGSVVKKQIQGRYRNIFVDEQRYQYVRMKDKYVRISDLK